MMEYPELLARYQSVRTSYLRSLPAQFMRDQDAVRYPETPAPEALQDLILEIADRNDRLCRTMNCRLD